MRIHHLLTDTRAEGFGVRFCIWVQGCPHHCPGCMARNTWDAAGGTEFSERDILELLEKRMTDIAKAPLEGITFLGGEPFSQARALSRIGAFAKSKDLSVITFTGYTLEYLKETPPEGAVELLACTDLLIDGLYLQAQRSFSRPWVGSENQRFLFLTDRYSNRDLEKEHNRCEIRIDRRGTATINGMADFETLWVKLLSNQT